ncbi:MAG: cytochrome b/b6 domain-containing protein [Pseudaminobacter sp.]
MLRNGEESFGLVAILFHWIIAVLFLGQVVLGVTMQWVHSMALQFVLIQWHKSFGFLLLGLSVLRLVWAGIQRRPRAVATLGTAERYAAWAMQSLLYLLLLALPLAGWALVSSSTLDVPSFAFNLVVIPDLPLVRSEASESFWREIHQWLAYGAALLVAGHMGAALRHHFWLGDEVLKRMLRPGRA